MVKVFTIDDVVEVPVREHMTGVVDTIWCHVLFKGCSNPVEFVAWKRARNEFSKALLEKLQAGEYGELSHGMGSFQTQPKEQEELEAEIREKRDQLLIASDWTETPAGQTRLSSEKQIAFQGYRADLRDVPNQLTFPWEVRWPEKP